MCAVIDKLMIAPCGMNCGICSGYLRKKKKCPGCNIQDENKPRYCIVCRIKNCDEFKEMSGNYCFSCRKFPCTRLKQLDKRYRTRYGMSMIDNLKMIEVKGIDEFMLKESQRWKCEKCGSMVCVHTWKCSGCGYQLERPSAEP